MISNLPDAVNCSTAEDSLVMSALC